MTEFVCEIVEQQENSTENISLTLLSINLVKYRTSFNNKTYYMISILNSFSILFEFTETE